MPGPQNLKAGVMPQLQNNGWFPSGISWADLTPHQNPLPDEMALSYEGGNQGVKHIMIYAADLYQACADLLGTNVADNQNPINYTVNGKPRTFYNLKRTPPMAHPIMTWWLASRIASVKEYITDVGAGDGAAPRKGTYPGAVSAYGTLANGITTTVPRWLVLTVLFQQPKFRILTDDQLDNPAIVGTWSPDGNANFRSEFERYLEGWEQPKTETITQESRTGYFVETGTGQDAQNNNTACGTGPGGGQFSGLIGLLPPQQGPLPGGGPVSFPSPWPAILKKAELVLRWKRVPMIGLLSRQGRGKATTLSDALQTVNSFKIFDYDAGTLKFEGYRLIPLESPVPPYGQAAGLPQGFPLGMANLYFDVDLAWSAFDPPYDATATSAVNGPFQGGPTRGHNLGPWRGTVAGDRTGNNLWYKIGGNPPTGQQPGLTDGDPLLFQFYDHRLLTTMTQ